MRIVYLGAAVAALAFWSAANAATFSGDFGVTYNTSSTGLQIGVSPLQAADALSFSLDPGQSTSINLYQIFADETTVNGDDTIPQAISTLLNISGATSSETISGSTVGVKDTDGNPFGAPGNHQYGQVSWSAPETFTFSDGSSLTVSLNNTRFNEGEYYALDYGSFPYSGDAESNGAPITATFTFEGAAAPISGAPEPGVWSLMIGGIGALGSKLRRMRRSAAGAYGERVTA